VVPPRPTVLLNTRSVSDTLKIIRAHPSCKLRPWLQDFSHNGVSYGPAEVKAQIVALDALGVHQYLLWNPHCRYTEAALTPSNDDMH